MINEHAILAFMLVFKKGQTGQSKSEGGQCETLN